MRDIKFKAWDKWNKEWYDFEDSLQFAETGFINECRMNDWEDERFELVQYVGLKDKNNKDIYEGDIIKTNLGTIGEVQSGNGGEWLMYYSLEGFGKIKSIWDNTQRIEVIGNIFQNKNLLQP